MSTLLRFRRGKRERERHHPSEKIGPFGGTVTTYFSAAIDRQVQEGAPPFCPCTFPPLCLNEKQSVIVVKASLHPHRFSENSIAQVILVCVCLAPCKSSSLADHLEGVDFCGKNLFLRTTESPTNFWIDAQMTVKLTCLDTIPRSQM